MSLRDALADIPQPHLAKACCEMSRRDGAIVAGHVVPGTVPPQKSRPVGYGYDRCCPYRTRLQTFHNKLKLDTQYSKFCGYHGTVSIGVCEYIL